MKAIILAAGFGRRMQPLTNSTPKTLLEVSGKTIISRIIKSLIKNNVNEVVIATGHKSEQLKSYLIKSFKNVKFSFVHNKSFRTTNNIFTLALVFNKIKINTDILIIESDLVFTDNVLKTLIESKYKNVALISEYETGMDGTVVRADKEKIIEVIPPHLQDENFSFQNKFKTLNLYKFDRDFCQKDFKNLLKFYTNSFDSQSYYELILGILIYVQKTTINFELVSVDEWAEVDDPNDLKLANYKFSNKSKKKILENSQGGYWNYKILDFCFIRNMYFPSSSMLSEIKNNFSELAYNYGSKQEILNEKLSYVLNINKNNLLVVNGLSQIYPILKNIIGKKNILVPTPTFGEYERFENISTYPDNFKIELKNISKKLKKSFVCVIVNPNNPTGTIIDNNHIIKLAINNKDKIFIIDESFIDFSYQDSIIKTLEKEKLDNIIVMQSLSKSYGIPGIRIGFVYTTNEKYLNQFKKDIPIWNMNSIAEFYLEILLKNKDDFNDSITKTKKDRDKFINKLKSVKKIKNVHMSEGNYIMIQTTKQTNLVEKLLNNYGIFIKDLKNKKNVPENCYRLAIRLPHENIKLVNALKEILI